MSSGTSSDTETVTPAQEARRQHAFLPRCFRAVPPPPPRACLVPRCMLTVRHLAGWPSRPADVAARHTDVPPWRQEGAPRELPAAPVTAEPLPAVPAALPRRALALQRTTDVAESLATAAAAVHARPEPTQVQPADVRPSGGQPNSSTHRNDWREFLRVVGNRAKCSSAMSEDRPAAALLS